MNRYIKLLPLLLVLIICSCSKEETTFTPTESSTQMRATLSGVVLDINEEPVQDANVYYNGASATTNSSGIYKFNDVSVDSKHNTVSITKNGYFEAARTFRSSVSNKIFHQTILLVKNPSLAFQSGQGGEVKTDNVTLVFAPNSIMYDGNKEDYNGEVLVAITYLDPTDIELEKKMPGDLTSLSSENIIQKSTSYGMVFVELQSGNGDVLQLKEGSVANLKLQIPDELISLAPQSLDASHFDEELGLWKAETKATLTGSTYEAEVTHFSSWNYNSSLPSVIITGRVVDGTGLPVPGLYIQISEPTTGAGGYGFTDQNGVFTGAVTKDVSLNIYIYPPAFCDGIVHLYTDNIGPFSNDVNIGDVTVDISSLEFITVNASFFNCDGDPVTNGIAYVARRYFEITDGTLNVTVPVCENDPNYILWVHDLDTDRVSETLPLVPGQVNSYEDYTICTIEARFFEIIAPGLGFDETSMVEIGAWNMGEDKTVFGFYNADLPEDILQINIEYTDTDSDGFELGTWDISKAEIIKGAFTQELVYSAGLGEGEVTIDDAGTDGLSNFARGSYRIDFKDVDTGTVYEFSGNFLLRTN